MVVSPRFPRRRLHLRLWVRVGLVALVVTACGRAAPGPSGKAADARPAASLAEGYMAPPELTGAERQAGGVLVLRGRAAPGSRVRLAAPDGGSASAVADAAGVWSATVPAPADRPAMYALAAELGVRVLRSEGAVLLSPPPGPPAILVRAGYAALALGAPEPRPRVVAVDYDAGGAAAVAGFSPARAEVRLSLDGRPAGLDQSDAQGRFAVLASNGPLPPGPRRLDVESAGGRAEVLVAVTPPAPLTSPFRAVREAGAWRVDWAPAGGGVQTTLVFDEPARTAP